MTLNEIILAYPTITKLADDATLSTKTKYKICLLLNELTPSIEFFEKERLEIIAKYNTSEDPDAITIPTEKIEEFNKDVQELIDTEFEGELKKGEISMDSELPLTAAEMKTLLPFFDFTE